MLKRLAWLSVLLAALMLGTLVAAQDAPQTLRYPIDSDPEHLNPFLADTMTTMTQRGVRRAIGVLAAAQRSYSGCLQYKENVRDARAAIEGAGHPGIDIIHFCWVRSVD